MYRDYVQRKGRSLGLVGTVQNLDNGQAKGMIDEISSASTLKDDIDKGQELLKGFTEVFSGKAPQAARFKVSDLRAVLKGTTSEYVDVPMNQEP